MIQYTYSFQSLLQKGLIADALQQRIKTLENHASAYRQDLEAAKITGIGLTVMGLALSANPLIAVLSVCGFAGYGIVACIDNAQTGRFCPLPLTRKSLSELFASIGLSVSGDSEDQDPILHVVGYLEPDLSHEYELLVVSELQLADYLRRVSSDFRHHAYQQILRFTKIRNTLKLSFLNDQGITAFLPPTQNIATVEFLSAPEPVLTSEPKPSLTQRTVSVVSPTAKHESVDISPEVVPPQSPTQEPSRTESSVPAQNTFSMDTKEIVPPTLEPVPAVPPTLEPVPAVPPILEPVPAIPPTLEPVPAIPPTLEQPVPAVPPTLTLDWMKNLIAYPALIFGGMGAGKSWSVRQIIQLKIDAGWNVVVLDPHGSSVEWQGTGIKLITGYAEIANFLKWYIRDTSQTRYDNFRESCMSEKDWEQHLIDSKLNYCVTCEEMSNWGDRVDVAGGQPGLTREFVKTAMTDSRKQLAIPLFVAHGRELDFLGDAKNLSKLRDATLLEVELIPQIHPTTMQAVASGRGKMKLPGHKQWLDVRLPKVEQKIINFTQSQSKDKVRNDASSVKSEKETFSSTQLLCLIAQMQHSKLSQTQIIKALWGVEKDKAGWKKAYAEYKALEALGKQGE